MPLDEEAREAVRALVERVAGDPSAPAAARLRWAVTDNLHLTVRFLGATPPDRVADVAAAAVAAAGSCAPFTARLEGAGAFPSAARPRVLWLGVESGASELAVLAGRLTDELAARGWPPGERQFRGHLTLGRSDGIVGAGRAVDALVAAAATLDAAWTVDRLVVYQSVLGRGAPKYRPLAVARLGGTSLPDEARLG